MSERTIYTLGYTGMKPDAILDVAEALDAYIVDTRISPRSRARHWNGGVMVKNWGARYVHLEALGNLHYKTPGEIVIKDLETGLDQLAELLSERSVILLCACADHRQCHRTTVANAAADRFNLPVVHLSPEYVTDLLGD